LYERTAEGILNWGFLIEQWLLCVPGKISIFIRAYTSPKEIGTGNQQDQYNIKEDKALSINQVDPWQLVHFSRVFFQLLVFSPTELTYNLSMSFAYPAVPGQISGISQATPSVKRKR
jgi:hypothetical protein